MIALNRALRNALVINWFAACDPGRRGAIRCLYAAAYGMPSCELGTYDEFIQDPEVLEWVAERFANTIALFEEDSL